MKFHLKHLVAMSALAIAGQVSAQVLFYEQADFQGRSVTTDKALDDFVRAGFNDRAESIIVLNNRWEVCDDSYYGGRCVILRQGRYPTLQDMGMSNRISSVREVHPDARFDESRYAPLAPQPVYDSRRRRNEKTFEAKITDVRAVLGTPAQRCWTEREKVQSNNNQVPAALAGALIGGILGHQVGGGAGKNLATAGGVVAGAAVGANLARNNSDTSTRDVQRCDSNPVEAKAAYWDVTYNFRGQEHHVQMATQPRSTITVNARGEPRA